MFARDTLTAWSCLRYGPGKSFLGSLSATPFAIYRRNAIGNAVDYAKIRSRSHNAVIHVYDGAGNAVETHEHAGDSRSREVLATNEGVLRSICFVR